MLSLASMASGQEGYYLDLAREDYYLNGGEPLGQWFGRGAEALGLQGVVTREQLTAVLGGKAPDGAPLGQLQEYRDGRRRQPGWDLTFSAPKSVSLLWATGSRELSHAVQAAHLAGVRAALGYLEGAAAVSRRGHGGETAESVGLVVATFEHGTSRAQDPQLHTHALVTNAGLRTDGSFGALRSRDLYLHKMAAGALYRAELARELLALGIKLRKERFGYEIDGIPRSLLDVFSTRRADIQAKLIEHGARGPKAAEFFAKVTREAKGRVPREELLARWRGVCQEAGFGLEQVTRLTGGVARSLVSGARKGQLESALEAAALSLTISKAASKLARSQGHFTPQQLTCEVAETLVLTGIPATRIAAAVRAVLDDGLSLVRLGGERAQERLTTKEMYSIEERLLRAAERSRSSQRHVVPDRVVEEALRQRPTLNEEQRAALRKLTTDPGSIQCLSGMPGTGKTYLLGAARQAWEASGFSVFGCALSARAARELQSGAEIESSTIAKLLRFKLPGLDKNSILVVDEASMAGTRDLERLVSTVTASGGKVVLVGDERQLQAIEAGGAFVALSGMLGAAKLVDIQRQDELWMRDAVRQFGDGDARGALTQYALAERLHVAKSGEDAAQMLISAWAERRTPHLKDTLIMAGTNQAVDRLNELAQLERAKRGEAPSAIEARKDGVSYRVGDRVVFTKNNRTLGVLNGEFGTVEAVSFVGLLRPRPLLLVRPDKPVSHDGGKPTLVTVDLRETELRLGYAVTTHKAQGATVERAFVLAGGWMQDRELAYVQMSRSRGETRIFVSEEDSDEDLVELTRAMERSRQKELAIEIQRQAHDTASQRSRIGSDFSGIHMRGQHGIHQ